MHIFHSECLQQWIKTKYERPDCPSCRLAIVLEEEAPLSNEAVAGGPPPSSQLEMESPNALNPVAGT